MAVNRLKYAQKYEQLRAQGVPHNEAHRQAVEFATVKETKPKSDKKKSRLKRIARLAKMAALGKHYRPPKEELPPAVRRQR